MAVPLKDKKIGTLILIVFLGIIIGAFLNELVLALMPDGGVVKTFFTTAVEFGFKNFDLDLKAVRFQFGIQFKFTLLSIIGVFLSLYLFRWYK